MKTVKLNKDYPTWELTKFCMFWTNVSSVIMSMQEIAYYYLIANNYLPAPSELYTLNTAIWIFTLSHWRIVHFYVIHRVMHPWKTKYIPDFGNVLYKWVHALHHKSYNPTAWSGVSMHPIESFLYFSVSFIPAFFGAHPFVFLATQLDALLGAIWGHDGFGEPGSASYPHYLHHKYFDYNYGETYVPIDWLFNSFKGDEKDDSNKLSK